MNVPTHKSQNKRPSDHLRTCTRHCTRLLPHLLQQGRTHCTSFLHEHKEFPGTDAVLGVSL